jgi:hypothetical protein
MSGILVVLDATHANISSLPANVACAGYVTGTPDIVWTTEDWNAHPGAIRIDQSPSGTVWDATADVDDYETGAVQLSELAPRAKLRIASFKNGTRPGQRSPLVYVSADNVSQVANALVNGGVNSGVGLFVANWDLTQAQAISDVTSASGPFPIEVVQYHNAGLFDMSIASAAWYNNVSSKTLPVSAGNGIQAGWRFCAKCSGLVHLTGPGICSGGGTHATNGSHSYTVTWDDASN